MPPRLAVTLVVPAALGVNPALPLDQLTIVGEVLRGAVLEDAGGGELHRLADQHGGVARARR